ncbi:MAG TPA: hypothetical protein DEQ02_04845 [Ruminococcaceae bacterium]|nr:hypothetical protein [Oscillospiraceae bacterium]
MILQRDVEAVDYKTLAEMMFPEVTGTPEELETRFPKRELPQGASVTRFAPSPTGFLHIGGLFAALVCERAAHQSGGVFFLRIEDTDKKREIEGGVSLITEGLRVFGITPDEGIVGQSEESGNYGPYRQSERGPVYHIYAKWLIGQGLAYPCFCDENRLAEVRSLQEREKKRTGYYGEYAVCRSLSPHEAARRIENGEPYVLRLRSPGDESRRIKFTDLIKGEIEMPENDQDIVLLKSDGIPTYHFAHAADDHLMRTTAVIRGDEWISSINIHLQLFWLLGLKPPKYAHIAPIMKEEQGKKRKLSKRKDPEAAVSYYAKEGYPAGAVTEYLMTIASSDFEQWRRANKKAPLGEFKLNLKKMSISGALFDLAKLNDVSRGVISEMTAREVFTQVKNWAEKEDTELRALLEADPEYAGAIFSIDRGGAKPRKDIAKWSDAKDYLSYFYDQLFKVQDPLPDTVSEIDAAAILREYMKAYSPGDERDAWWEKLKSVCAPLGYSPDIKEYKKAPEQFKGHVGDVSTVIRLALTGRRNTPDLYSITRLLGQERVTARLAGAVGGYEEKNAMQKDKLPETENEAEKAHSNFIEDEINRDLETGVYNRVQTRFPPEPNGYLHIGHAKAICIDFGLAKKYSGICNLRLDDTNPSKEDAEYVEAIKEDIKWLGFEWANVYYASDYFDFIYECAIKLIKKGLAFVCDQSAEEMRAFRGTLTEPGRESPYRNRPVEENLELFARMTAGEFKNGEKVLRAKIDMASPNITMRDPVIYRILHMPHHQTGDKWCVYPMYDFTHCLSDAYEKVTHSLCTLEFENNRPIYNWFLEKCEIANPPRQIEFARMNVNYTLTSKRKCLKLVETGTVGGWDDPRMATLSGMRRRGYPPAAIRAFCEMIGVSKANSVIDFAMLESCVRDELNQTAERAMAVLRPLRVIIENYPAGKTETVDVEINPNKPELGTRPVEFSGEIFIEREDFMKEPVKGYFRLFPGTEVRLKGAYIVKCTGFDKDENGEVTAVRCTYDELSRGGSAPDGRKVKGTLHWVSASSAADAEIRLYDRLFTVENPSAEEDYLKVLNPDSLITLTGCKLEQWLTAAVLGERFQFMRQGYFCADITSTPEKPVINRIVALKDSWAKKK